MEDDTLRHHGPSVQRGVSILDCKIDSTDPEFPCLATLQTLSSGEIKTFQVRSKYMIGADGAHSVVRRSMGVNMQGDTLDDIWGVIDFVPETNWPDIRRPTNVVHTDTHMLHIPRERNREGERLSRMYVLFGQGEAVGDAEEEVKGVRDGLKADVEETPEIDCDGNGEVSGREKARKALRNGVTFERILERAKMIFSPYEVDVKRGTEVEWWAAYQVGQRVAERMIVEDGEGMPRVFLMGDASHTHSPKLGQVSCHLTCR